MKLNKILLSMGICLTAVSGAALADASTTTTTDSTHVYFDGSITNVPCSMPNTSREQHVQMGSIASHVLENGGTSSPVSFKFDLKDCPVGNTVAVTFDGAADPNSKELIALGSGTASGAGIMIMADGSPVKLGTPVNKQPLAEGDNTLTYSAMLKGDGKKEITTGDFSAVSNVVFTYN